jgi:hypothetical protein
MRHHRVNIRITAILILSAIFLFQGKNATAQRGLNDTIKVQAVIYQGDTIVSDYLSNVSVICRLTKAQKEALAKYNRLRNAVYVTYPYARKAGIVLNDINAKLASITDRPSRKKYINSREKELKKEFTTPLTNLSIYQGKILMKLINRETGNNCYEIIKEYQGGLTARLYQTIAFFFNSNLKQAYDARNEDVVIEKFVQEVQHLYGYSDIAKPQVL